jgi:putative heme-binding domain-containing protein
MQLPLALVLALCVQSPPTSESLFDGQSLNGWRGDGRFWSVEEGAIVGRSTEANPCGRTTWLVYDGGRHEHFELSLEVQLEGGNSGVQFRSRELQGFEVHGPQADHDASGEWTGGIYEQGGRGVLVRRGAALVVHDDGRREPKTIGDATQLLTTATAREWDRVTIRCEGRSSKVHWNGVLTSQLLDGGPGTDAGPWRGDGVIALQLHAGPPMTVRFRDIRLTRLTPPFDEALAVPGQTQSDGTPQWIWAHATPSGLESVALQRRVEPRGAIRRATLWGACDNGVEVFAGERRIAVADDWAKPFQRDVTGELPEGPFELVARCWNEGGPAALVLRLTLEYADGSREDVVTDTTWRVESGGTATSFGPFGVAPWGLPATSSDGTARGVLDPAALVLPAGFEASLVYEVPRREGSWVAVTTDDRGRIYCADERDKGVFRVTERAGTAPLVEPLPLGLPAAQGLCAVRTASGGLDLYVMVNAFGSDKSNGLWRARDAADDGVFEEIALLMPLPNGAGEHGAHAIVEAPDKSGLYVIAGNHTSLPADVAVFHTPPIWQEDDVLPRIPDPNGHAVGVPVPGGWFVKTDYDGGRRELVSIGMRNAYDFALDRAGNALTYDSDMEWDMGAPWYRAPRILQLVPGADFGWRNGSAKVPDWAEDTMGSVVDTGPASPTGVLHTKDLAFHAPWDDVLLAADWAYGTVHAVTTRTEIEGGVTLTGELRPFIQGRPFPVTDLAAHPDGTLLVTIGGRGTRSGLYRVRSLAGVDRRLSQPPLDPIERFETADVPTLRDRAWRTYRRARLERQLEAGVDSSAALDAFTDRPIHRDRVAALPFIWASWQVVSARTGHALHTDESSLEELIEDLTHVGSEIRDARVLGMLRALEIALARAGADAQVPASYAAQLAERYPTGDRRMDRSLLTVLVRSQCAAVTPRAVARLVEAESQEEALFLAYTLRSQTAGWTPELVDTYLTYLHVDAAKFHGGHSLRRYVELIRDEARARLGADWAPPEAPARATPAPPVAAGIFVQQWTASDLAPRRGELDGRDLANGHRVFQAARCAECHRFGGDGGSTGPDLTGAGARYSAEDLLLAILEPSRDLTDQYQDTEVWTTDGIVHMGRVVEEDAEWLTLMPPPPNEADRIDVPQAEVKLRRPHPTSRMPAGLLDGFRREEVLDLLAHLLAAPTTGPSRGTAPGADGSDQRQSRVLEAQLELADQPGLAELVEAFAAANPGYGLRWLPKAPREWRPTTAAMIAFVQHGVGDARIVSRAGEETSPVRSGDVIVVRRGATLELSGVSALAFDVPTSPPDDVPTFVRPDFDARITDTPGGCAEESDAYRRILLTWEAKNGPYVFHALNAHRVRILDSFTHYHPREGGFDEFYLVQSAPPGAELLVSEQLDVLLGVAAVVREDVPHLIRRIPLTAGDLLYIPRGVVHRGLGGAVVQVVTVPGFVPGAEIGMDDAIRTLNARLGLSGARALPVHTARR